jgi:hypothetical protein
VPGAGAHHRERPRYIAISHDTGIDVSEVVAATASNFRSPDQKLWSEPAIQYGARATKLVDEASSKPWSAT